MRPLPRTRRQRPSDPADSPGTLFDLRRRLLLGAAVSAVVFAAAFVTGVIRRPAAVNMAVIGIEMASSTAAAACGAAAVQAKMLAQFGESRQTDELRWAMELGEDLANARRKGPNAQAGGG